MLPILGIWLVFCRWESEVLDALQCVGQLWKMKTSLIICHLKISFKAVGPHTFWHQGPISRKTDFLQNRVRDKGMVSGWFKLIAFIGHFISIIITTAPPQIIRHQILEVADPCFRDQWFSNTVIVVQLLSHIRHFTISRTAVLLASLWFTISCSLLKLMSTESVMPSNHLVLCHPILLLHSGFPRSGSFPISWLFASSGQTFELQLQHQPFSECLGLISFRIHWFDLLAVQETLKSLLQHHSSKVSILWHSAFFMVQPTHLTWLLEKA